MRRWFFYLMVLGGLYVLFRLSGRKQDRSSFRKRLSETITIVIWALLAVYILSFLYWIFTRIFK